MNWGIIIQHSASTINNIQIQFRKYCKDHGPMRISWREGQEEEAGGREKGYRNVLGEFPRGGSQCGVPLEPAYSPIFRGLK